MLPLMLCFSTVKLSTCLVVLGSLAEGKIKPLAFSGKKKNKTRAFFLAGAHRTLSVGEITEQA